MDCPLGPKKVAVSGGSTVIRRVLLIPKGMEVVHSFYRAKRTAFSVGSHYNFF